MLNSDSTLTLAKTTDLPKEAIPFMEDDLAVALLTGGQDRSYARLLRYVAITKPRLFHILWNSKLEYFDRTVLMIYFKFFGKRVILTAHNVNKARRDSEDSLIN